MDGPFYLDELRPGQTFRSGTRRMTAEDIVGFAAAYDPQPFHLDEAAAAATPFGGLAASGWHTAAVTMRLLVDGGAPIAGGLIGAGVEVAWPRPTRAGDVLSVTSEVTEVRAMRSDPSRGIVTLVSETRTAAGDVVQRMTSRLVVPRRPRQ